MQYKISYTAPKLCDYKGDLTKNWFVFFEITNHFTGEKKRLQFRQTINYHKTAEDRYALAEKLLKNWERDLKDGWHPWQHNERAFLPFCEALTYALSKCEVATKTKSCYKSTVKYVTQAAEELGYDKIDIKNIERRHIKEILSYGRTEFNWTNARYNKHIGYLSSVLSRLEDDEIIKFNPANKIRNLPVAETEGFLPFTEAERDAIRELLFINHYRFYVFLMVEVHTGIRPKEILALRIKDIDMVNKMINIIPDLKAENSKVKKKRHIPIPNELIPFLRELNLRDYDKRMYAFGSPFESGKGAMGRSTWGKYGTDHPDYFKPSFTRIKRDTVTRLWKRLIIDGLGIDKHLYGGKHTGANMKILAGVSLDALQRLYGHSSKLITERYAKEVKQVHYKELREISPTF